MTNVASMPQRPDGHAPETARATDATPGGAGAARARATLRFMLAHPAHWIALGMGSGLSPLAPGTAGTLWAWIAWVLLEMWLSPAELGWLLAASLPIAWWACSVTADHLATPDPSAIVADEIIAFWLILWLLLPAGFWAQLIAFLLFRFFDAVKPQPVRWADALLHAERGWRGGFGIMLDDLVAAGCALFLIALWYAW